MSARVAQTGCGGVPGLARRALFAVAVGSAALTCGPRQGPQAAAPASGAPSPLPGGPAPPRSGLLLPGLMASWAPPTLTAGDSQALAAALTEYPAIELLLGPGLTGAGARLGSALAHLSPTTRVTSVRTADQAGIVDDPAKLVATRESGAGRPRYRAEGLKIQGTWLKRHDPEAQGIVSVDAAAVELAAWRALPAAAVGGCDPAFRALAEAQEQGLAQLEGFLNHADALLWRYYSAELKAFVPEIQAELGRYADAAPPGDADARAQHECGQAYLGYVKPYVGCAADSRCPVAPRVVLSAGGARIAAAEPPLAVSDRCPVLIGRDVPSELRQLAVDAAEAAAGALDGGWSTLADRLGAIPEVHAGLEDICSPRRWRFAAADLEEARARLGRIGEALASPELARPQSRWRVEVAPLHVPGAGTMRQLARFEAGEGSINHTIGAEARALREFVLSRALCRSGHDPRPLAVLVADASSGAARFFGYLYAEELACGDLPPAG